MTEDTLKNSNYLFNGTLGETKIMSYSFTKKQSEENPPKK